MLKDAQPLAVRIQASHADTGVPLGSVAVEAYLQDGAVLAHASTGPDGFAQLMIDPDKWRSEIFVRVASGDANGVLVDHAALDGGETVSVAVKITEDISPDSFALLADDLVTRRLVRAEDLIADLQDPAPDSGVRLLSASDRVTLIDRLARELSGHGEIAADGLIVDPPSVRNGDLTLVPIGDFTDRPGVLFPIDPTFTKPGLGWGTFPWALPDDQSYRDYLRTVFVLFAQQQKLGVIADPTSFPDVVLRQLPHRFFQDFMTADRTEVPLNRLLIPIVTAILTAPKGSGFGFAIPAASLPVQGTAADRQHLDVLLAAAPISVQEFANRYRLQLSEPDTTLSTPVRVNVYTLSRILSDTAQGPIEPPDNVIEPQLPGTEGKTILWKEVVGSAPFFLRFDEWLARQQPFYPENLFALRTQIEGVALGVWLTDDRKKFLEYHRDLATSSISSYNGNFATMDEVHRSATFLLSYGVADAKLTELVAAIDTRQFGAAARLADEAEHLLQTASPSPKAGEDWEPNLTVGGWAQPLSFSRRRKVKVTTITALTGTRSSYLPDGFERFYELSRPADLWKDVSSFRDARDQATRKRTYQQAFVLPMLRASIRTGLGDLPGAVDAYAQVTGLFVGIAMVGTPAGMVRYPDSVGVETRVVAGKLRWNDQLGDRPYTARLMYDEQRNLLEPFSLTPQYRPPRDVLTPDPPILHLLEERYARIAQADAILAWAEALYRTDDAALLERARELYKSVIFLHGEDPGTSAYLPRQLHIAPWMGLTENPRRRNQIDRARLAMQQLEAGLNFYGYHEDAVPTLRYQTLVDAAQRWVSGARSAQSDYLTYLGRVEQLDLDMLAAKAQEQKAAATVQISTELVEIAKAGVVVAQKAVADVQKLIAAKKAEIEDKNSIFSQFSDYFSGMKSSVSSLVDTGKSVSEGYSALSGSSAGEALGLGQGTGGGAGAGGGAEAAGLGSAAGGFAVLGAYGAFVVLSTTTLQGMADAATKRQGDLTALINEALPAAQAGVRVQERNVAITQLQGQIAVTDLAYARDLVNYQNERFLNRDFWDALAGVAGRSLHRYLDLAGQAAWFAERALAYRLASPMRLIKLGYFDPRMRDLGGPDRLALDLAELEAVRLGAARVSVPITRTYSLARDLPLAFGQLKRDGRCTFSLSDDDLLAAYPGTFGHRIRAVEVAVDVPGTAVAAAGMLTNSGFSLLRRAPGDARVPLLRYADAYPISEFRIRSDGALHGMPGEQLMPFEGAAFTTTWTLELPPAANPAGLQRLADVRITFDLEAGYDARTPAVTGPAPAVSRSMVVSALALDPKGLATLHAATGPIQVTFGLDRLAVPASGVVTNLAVVLPGISGGTFSATLAPTGGPATPFVIEDGLALSNLGVLDDGDPSHAQPLNAAAGGGADRAVSLTITRAGGAGGLAKARDVLLWVEYDVP
ncbi:hypothetical protein CLV47_10856 [Antricoccus suffuscus]|uniref:Tc toxin complex TcA C-terminal TcB-binding domain-containing protein n=1 Tax=Antricoccus suffuscus TaxID=1629062 RepID=A0A2T0ZZN1_9ACTN|nr:hypothetical protein [Antricoccus suffuscus]PRZ41697.1 hypothetical protein CLV47_10856 [Antricoccus suffuscus]